MSSWTDKRPMSPHVSIWKWHMTMASSILHRVTGCAIYVGAFLIVAWLFAAAAGPDDVSFRKAIRAILLNRRFLSHRNNSSVSVAFSARICTDH